MLEKHKVQKQQLNESKANKSRVARSPITIYTNRDEPLCL